MCPSLVLPCPFDSTTLGVFLLPMFTCGETILITLNLTLRYVKRNINVGTHGLSYLVPDKRHMKYEIRQHIMCTLYLPLGLYN